MDRVYKKRSAAVEAPKVRLCDVSYYGTGGTARQVFEPTSSEDLAKAVRQAQDQGWPLMLLGGGTNSLVMDDHFDGAVILFRRLAKIEVSGTKLTVGAGVENTSIARKALAEGLSGAAWMYRLPGQIGGTVRMNARCYGGEISEIVSRVRAVTPAGEIRDYTDKSMFRGYKDTLFMENGDLIAEVDLVLKKGDESAIEAAMLSCEVDRVKKGQFLWPSCGCVFKNDYQIGIPSGMLLEAAGAKGLRRAGAVVSQYHSNFVYNRGASARDILELTLAMRERVFQIFGVWLQYEMEILGHLPPDLKARVTEQRLSLPHQQKLDDLRQKFVRR